MNKLVLYILEAVLLTCRPYIPLVVPVAFHDAIYSGDKDVASYVKLTLVVQERVLHVLLDKCRAHAVR